MILGLGSAVSTLAFAVFAAVTAPAAPTGQDEAAQQAFRAGVEAARQERWIEARSLFEKAYGFSPRPVVLINLAGAQARTGRLTEAAKNYHRILDDEGSPETTSFRHAAAEILPSLEARIPRVKLRHSGLAANDVIRIDGDVVEAAVLAAGHPLDPGEHTLVVAHGEVERARVLFALSEREVREIALPLPSVVGAPVAIARDGTVLDPTPARGGGPPAGTRWWASPWTWTAVAVVVVGASAATYLVATRDEPGFSGNISPGHISVR